MAGKSISYEKYIAFLIMWKGAAHWCCRVHLLVHTMRSARDPPPALGTNTSLLQSSGRNVKDHLTESLTWCRPDTSSWKHGALYVHVTKNTSTHASKLWGTGLYSSTSALCVCGGGDYAWEKKLAHTLHCDAWVVAMLPELIQSFRHIHFPQYLKHIIERGGANLHVLINHRVSISAGRLHISKWMFFIHLGGISFRDHSLIYCTSTGSWVSEPCWFTGSWHILTMSYTY